ncbi:unnamed protein product, partial [Musa textilis]
MESMIETGVLGDAGKQEHQILNTGVGFTGRQSELTCNASGSRKRAREDSMTLPSLHNPALSPLIPITGVLLQSRSLESGATSTSGRHVPSSQVVSPPVRDLVSLLLQQNLEIDALVRVQSEGLRIGLEEARKRHCRTLLSMLEQLAAKRLMEKEAELETASRRNAELEEKVRQLSEENQMWFTMAKNNEEIACGLRTSLEQALLQGAPAAAGHERFGDGDGDGTGRRSRPTTRSRAASRWKSGARRARRAGNGTCAFCCSLAGTFAYARSASRRPTRVPSAAPPRTPTSRSSC